MRNITFGYCLENGTVQIKENEAEVVKIIFNHYLAGYGLKCISDLCTALGVPYNRSGPKWNKNMINRVVMCDKYIGNSGYPAIIPTESYYAANENKSSKYNRKSKPEKPKPPPVTPSAEIRTFKPTLETIKSANDVLRLMESKTADSEQIKTKIMLNAASRYACCVAERNDL